MTEKDNVSCLTLIDTFLYLCFHSVNPTPMKEIHISLKCHINLHHAQLEILSKGNTKARGLFLPCTKSFHL